MKEEEKYGPDVTLYPDGKYRWIYEMNLYTKVYASVKNIKVRRRRHLIKVNQLFNKNQVYVPDAHFDFVLDYIRSRCPQVKQ